MGSGCNCLRGRPQVRVPGQCVPWVQGCTYAAINTSCTVSQPLPCGQAEDEWPPAPAKGHMHRIAATQPWRQKTAWLSVPGVVQTAAAGCAGPRLPQGSWGRGVRQGPGEHGSARVTVCLSSERTTPARLRHHRRAGLRYREFPAQPSDNFECKYVSKERTSAETAPCMMPSPATGHDTRC